MFGLKMGHIRHVFMLMRMIHGKREVNKTKERMSVLEGMKGLMNLAHIWRH